MADQIDFFGKRSKQNQNRYKWLKAGTFLAAAVISVSATIGLESWVPAVLGAAIFFMEGMLGLSASHQNWLVYRNTCERLKHEKYLFLAKAGSYRNVFEPEPLLAERLEEILSTDRGKWVAIIEGQPNKPKAE